MKLQHLIFWTITVLIILGWGLTRAKHNGVYVRSSVDGNSYWVQPGNAEEKANQLGALNLKIMRLLEVLQPLANDPERGHVVRRLTRVYDDSIMSEAEVSPGMTSYTINKRHIKVCLRSRDSQQSAIDPNLLVYVLLHELAHVGNWTPEGIAIDGHGPEFLAIFQLLVTAAVQAQIYTLEDYELTPEMYCGLLLNSQVLNSLSQQMTFRPQTDLPLN